MDNDSSEAQDWRELNSQALPFVRPSASSGHDKAPSTAAAAQILYAPVRSTMQRSKHGLVIVNGAELYAQGASTPELDYLPFLSGYDGYIVRGWSHLISSFPKGGKTELIARLCKTWTKEHILYFTEEGQSVWEWRLHNLGGDWSHLFLAFAIGAGSETVRDEILTNRPTVVIIDTIRNVLILQDENDNSEVARTLAPIVGATRECGATLVLAHHLRKSDGAYGTQVAGGGALVGAVDCYLEVHFTDSGEGSRRRKIKGQGRLITINELVYEMQEDGQFVVLGSPKALNLEGVRERVLGALSSEWQDTTMLREALDDPKPGKESLRSALQSLHTSGRIERDPPEGGQGKTYRCRLSGASNFPLPLKGSSSSLSEVATSLPTGNLSVEVGGKLACPNCGGYEWWKRGSDMLCARCHPPANGVPVVVTGQ